MHGVESLLRLVKEERHEVLLHIMNGSLKGHDWITLGETLRITLSAEGRGDGSCVGAFFLVASLICAQGSTVTVQDYLDA